MRDYYSKSKNKKLGSGSAANARNNLRDESMVFLDDVKTSNTRSAVNELT